METYLILFSLDCSEDLEARYNKISQLIPTLGTNCLEFTKTGWLLRSKASKNYIRDSIMKVMRSGKYDGRLLVLEVGLVGWSLHLHDTGDDEIGRWIKRYVSGD